MAPIRTVQLLVLLVGALVGIWHLWLAARAIVVFSFGEPWSSWAAVLLGPGLTLIAVVVAIFNTRLAGAVLLVGACLALSALAVGDGPQYSTVVPFLIRVVLPMVALGAALLALAHCAPKIAPKV